MPQLNKKKYLIIPPMPTPNGPLHLGHIGGPFLRADILTRYLRMCGHHVAMLSGTDCYESFVLLQAEKEQKPIESVCENYYHAIYNDLADMHIHPDHFINPLDTKWSVLFQEWHLRILDQLKKNQAVQLLNEQILWDEKNSRYVAGCWLDGRCPFCQGEVTGHFCDRCGGHFRPEQVSHEYDHTPREVENLFLRIPCVFDLTRKGIGHAIQEQYRHFLRQQNGLMRLSVDGVWGLSCGVEKILFSYGFVYAYYLFLGDIARQIFNSDNNAFSAHSDVVTIASFGIDNAVPVFASVLGISAYCPEFKPVDYYLVNYFYHLNDSKFSTSRSHVIWVRDIIRKLHAESDVVRLYLASVDVSGQHNNFDSKHFIHQYNITLEWIIDTVLHPLEILQQPLNTDCDQQLLTHYTQAITTLAHGMQPHQLNPHEGIKVIESWLAVAKSIKPATNEYFWWLKGLAILLNPFMPQFSQRLWIALGYRGNPISYDFLSLPVTRLKRKIAVSLKRLNESEVLHVAI